MAESADLSNDVFHKDQASENLEQTWSIRKGYYYPSNQIPDPHILIKIEAETKAIEVEDFRELPREFVRYALNISQPELEGIQTVDEDIEFTIKNVATFKTSMSAQEIVDEITDKGRIIVPAFEALRDIANLYQALFINTNDLEELARFEDIRLISYSVILDFLNRQASAKKLPLPDVEKL